MNIQAIYPGTFDPITNGHIDLIIRGRRLFQRLIVAVAERPLKKPFFSIQERVAMVSEAIKDYQGVDVISFDCLLIECVKKHNAQVIIRGLRAVSDFEYELQIALVNRRQDQNIETLFLMPDENHIYLSSSIVKELAQYGGKIEELVPLCVARRLQKAFKRC